jgi:hypothetical protein
MRIYFTGNNQMKNILIMNRIIIRMNKKQDKKPVMTTKQLYHLWVLSWQEKNANHTKVLILKTNKDT